MRVVVVKQKDYFIFNGIKIWIINVEYVGVFLVMVNVNLIVVSYIFIDFKKRVKLWFNCFLSILFMFNFVIDICLFIYIFIK